LCSWGTCPWPYPRESQRSCLWCPHSSIAQACPLRIFRSYLFQSCLGTLLPMFLDSSPCLPTWTGGPTGDRGGRLAGRSTLFSSS
jgi:hypothetical protein